MSWIPPVVDRSDADILNKTNKAYLNADDLNRIENNTLALTGKLNEYNYNIKTNTRTWNINDIPTTADIKRICNNITVISDAYFMAMESSVCDPEYKLWNEKLSWKHLNDLEENLRRFEEMLDRSVHCNTHQDLTKYKNTELQDYSNAALRRAVLPSNKKPRMLPDGKIVELTNKGRYSASAVYRQYDYVVLTSNEGFLAKANGITNISPPNASVWLPWTW